MPLGSSVPSQASAFHPYCGSADPQSRQNTGQDHGGPCSLHMGGERQNGVLQCAAEHSSTVPRAVHPQPLQLYDGRYDVGACVHVHLPAGQQRGGEHAGDPR